MIDRVPAWPPADTPSRRGVPVPLALANVIVGYATSVLVESVRPFWASCNVQHKPWAFRCKPDKTPVCILQVTPRARAASR